MPKKSSLITDREREICGRLQEFRTSMKWPQKAFAFELGITRDQLASIEYCRTPLRYDLALRAGLAFNLNIYWLGSGAGPMTSNWGAGTGVSPDSLPRGALFSEVFDEYLKDQAREQSEVEIEARMRTGEDDDEPLPAIPDPIGYLVTAITRHLDKLKTPGEKSAFARSLVDLMGQVARKRSRAHHARRPFVCEAAESEFRPDLDDSARRRLMLRLQKRIEDLQFLLFQVTEGRTIEQSKVLDIDPQLAMMGDVKAMKGLWEMWLRKLKKICAAPGVKSRLAADLEVSRQHVSNWVSGETSPSAEFALRLVEWIKTEEAKPKT